MSEENLDQLTKLEQRILEDPAMAALVFQNQEREIEKLRAENERLRARVEELEG